MHIAGVICGMFGLMTFARVAGIECGERRRGEGLRVLEHHPPIDSGEMQL